MKKAIVFGGGGSKGAYQLGVWRALRELSLDFDIATGTSIGSINACLYVMHGYDTCEELWSTITVDKIMNNGLNLNHGIDYYIENFDTLLPFIKNYITYKGADVAPFKEQLEKYCDEQRFFDSEIDFALMTARFPSRAPRLIKKCDVKKNTLKDWILASASCFPAFPVCEIDGEKYIDGGYCDNLPIDAAFKLGACEVVAIPLKPLENIRHSSNPLIKYIRPSRDLGSFLCFERSVLDNNITLGYLDTMKAYSKLYGCKFAFKLDDMNAAQNLAYRVLRSIELFESDMDSARALKGDAYPLTSFLCETIGEPRTPIEGLLWSIETAMLIMDYSPYTMYSLSALLPSLYESSRGTRIRAVQSAIAKCEDKARLIKDEGVETVIAALVLNAARYLINV